MNLIGENDTGGGKLCGQRDEEQGGAVCRYEGNVGILFAHGSENITKSGRAISEDDSEVK